MVDFNSPFDKLRTFADYRRGEEEFNMAKQMAVLKAAGIARGTDLPAALQVANALGRARQSGDGSRLDDIVMAGKLLDKGVLLGGGMTPNEHQMPIPSNVDNIGRFNIDAELTPDFSNEQVAQIEQAVANTPAGQAGLRVTVPPSQYGGYKPMPMPGYGEAVGAIEATKKRMETQAQKDVELAMNPNIASAVKESEQLGVRSGENKVNYNEMRSRMPQLEDTVSRLSKLGQIATYTASGQIKNSAMRELGMDIPDSAVARAEYKSMVDNEILPLLRQTFGAQFTAQEGESLKATLGDQNASPREKDAVLRSFIRTKLETVNSLAREMGQEEPYSGDYIGNAQRSIGAKPSQNLYERSEAEFNNNLANKLKNMSDEELLRMLQ